MNPLSARMISPGSIKFKKPDSCVMYICGSPSPHISDKKLFEPFGGITMRNFTVLWWLYSDQVCACRCKCLGRSMNTSVQSTVRLKFLYLCLSDSGIFVGTAWRYGQWIRHFNSSARKFIHVLNTWEDVPHDTWNKLPKMLVSLLISASSAQEWTLAVRVLAGPGFWGVRHCFFACWCRPWWRPILYPCPISHSSYFWSQKIVNTIQLLSRCSASIIHQSIIFVTIDVTRMSFSLCFRLVAFNFCWRWWFFCFSSSITDCSGFVSLYCHGNEREFQNSWGCPLPQFENFESLQTQYFTTIENYCTSGVIPM